MADLDSGQPLEEKENVKEAASPKPSPTAAVSAKRSSAADDSYDSIDDDDLTPDSASIEWIRSKINVEGFDAYSDSEWKEEFEMTISDFLASPHITRLLISRRGKEGEMRFATNLLIGDGTASSATMTAADHEQLTATSASASGSGSRSGSKWQFFLKEANVSLISVSATRSAVQYGMVSGNRLESLEAMMQCIYLPSILYNEWWPDSVQKDLAEKLHKFMAALTESVNLEKGKTVLYVPRDIDCDGGVGDGGGGGAGDEPLDGERAKHSVRRLESTLIHWTRQIEEMVKNQTVENRAGDDSLGPLQEIEFWRARSIDLVSVREQLQKEGVLSILGMLRDAESTYLERFDALAGSIEFGSVEANENLLYLETLKAVCSELSGCGPAQIMEKGLLRELVLRMRMIWSTSSYYCCADRLTSLLRKVSNQIIIQCSAAIDLGAITSTSCSDDGGGGGREKVRRQMALLADSRRCGLCWKRLYEQQRVLVDGAWDAMDPSSIFAQIDAFIQRCRDLVTVCNGQLQFCRQHYSSLSVADCFGGARGNDILKSLGEIEEGFLKHMSRLQALQYDILDVNTTRWHEDYSYFKNGVKDLEVMMSNVINNAFDGITSIEDGVHLLSSFIRLSCTESMKANIDRKCQELYQLAIQHVVAIKRDFDKWHQAPPLNVVLPHSPKYGGAALWADALRKRLRRQIHVLRLSDCSLPPTKEKEEAISLSAQTLDVLTSYLREKHSEFERRVSAFAPNLALPILRRDEANANGLSLCCNFDVDLLRIFAESECWQNRVALTEFQAPFAARNLSENAATLRLLRDTVMLVVRDFNQICDALTATERALFSQHLKRIEKRLAPGLSKYSWTKKYIKEVFVKKCRAECQHTLRLIRQYHAHCKSIRIQQHKMRSIICIQIDKSWQPQSVQQFKEKQLRFLKHCNLELQTWWHSMHQSLTAMYRHFQGHPKDVQNEWALIVQAANQNIENALKHCIKASLLEFSRSINGDATSSANRDRADHDEVAPFGMASNAKISTISPLFKVWFTILVAMMWPITC